MRTPFVILVVGLILAAILWLLSGTSQGLEPTEATPDQPAVEDRSAAVDPPPQRSAERPPHTEASDVSVLSVSVSVDVHATPIQWNVERALARLVNANGRVDVGVRVPAQPPRLADETVVCGRQLVAFTLADGSTCCRDVTLRADSTVELEHLPARVVRGRVRGPRGTPVVGASIWLGEITATGEFVRATTDADGEFELEVAGGAGIPCVVRAPGFATAMIPIEVEMSGTRPVDLRLGPAATVEVRLASSVEDPTQAQVMLQLARRDSRALDYPTFLAGLEDRDRLDTEARRLIDDLPDDCQFEFGITHPALDDGPLVTHSTRARKTRAVVVVPRTVARTVRARVVDERGLPWPNLLVGFVGTVGVRTAADGSFVVAQVADTSTQWIAEVAPGLGYSVPARRIRDGAVLRLSRALRSFLPSATITLVPPPGTAAWRARLLPGEWRTARLGLPLTLSLPQPVFADVRLEWWTEPDGAPTARVERNVLLLDTNEWSL